jgi:putative heme-binding domain-containing protein
MKSLFLMLLAFPSFASLATAEEWSAATVPSQSALATPTWLRCYFTVPDAMTSRAEKDLWSDSVTLSVGDIPGPFSIWLNGQKIAEAASQPGTERRRFKVPKGILEKKVYNTLAIHLEGAARGIGMPPILAGYFDELLFEGPWEQHSGEVPPEDLKPVPTAPKMAVYLETSFKPSTTPLSANQEMMPGVKLPPAESLAKMTAADDLVVELMVSEPEVAQPTHVSFDDRGRMWVAQYRQYPYPAGVKMISRDKYYRSRFDRVPPAPPHHDPGKDIISVHEDTDGDGQFDKHTKVLQGLNMANSALRGHGGLWVMHTPYLLFYPAKDGDTLGEPEVRLAGFGLEDTHSVANGLAWGPDGWIYGGQGSTTTSRVVRPGLDPPDFPGVFHESCMVWRYHPDKKIYEIFAQGGGNTFELDFDAEGRLLSGHNGGDTHGFHFMQDALMLKQGLDPGKFGAQSNPFSFGYLDAIKSLNPIARFTHATIMADGSAMPARYAGRMLGADPLHRNVIVAERTARGSTFETKDSGVTLASADISCRPVYITNAPDGGIYVADFYEEFIAHGQNYQGQLDPSTGRIYRLRGKETSLNKDVNLAVKSSAELVGILAHPNRWHRQTAVRLLGERRDASVIDALKSALGKTETHPSLEALWALHQMGVLEESIALGALKHPQPSVRLWAIRLLGDAKQLTENFASAVVTLAASEVDAEVRAQIACTAHRLSATQGLPMVAALMKRETDASDPCIPLLCWWVLESHCAKDRDSVIASLTWDSTLVKEQILARLMRRFAATEARADLLTCAKLLETAPSAAHQKLLMTGFEEAFKGRALPPLPEPLVEALTRGGLASSHLRVRLREPEAVAAALKTLADSAAKLDERLLCVRLFGDVKFPDAVTPLLQLAIGDQPPALRKASLTALLSYEDERIGSEVSQGYAKFPAEVQSVAQTLLTSRPAWSLALLKLIETGSVPHGSLPPTTAELLRNHADSKVASLAKQLLTAAAPRPQARAEIDRLRGIIAASAGDTYKGETIYLQRCAGCHTLFQKGGKIGPDLTAYQREDLGTVLPSIVDPSAEIREGFTAQVVSTTDGRTLSGFLADQDNAAIVLRGLDGQNVSLARKDIREMRALPASLMPDGLLQGLSDQEIRDFFAYLRIPQPITR